jgi:hypothetical protein
MKNLMSEVEFTEFLKDNNIKDEYHTLYNVYLSLVAKYKKSRNDTMMSELEFDEWFNNWVNWHDWYYSRESAGLLYKPYKTAIEKYLNSRTFLQKLLRI